MPHLSRLTSLNSKTKYWLKCLLSVQYAKVCWQRLVGGWSKFCGRYLVTNTEIGFFQLELVGIHLTQSVVLIASYSPPPVKQARLSRNCFHLKSTVAKLSKQKRHIGYFGKTLKYYASFFSWSGVIQRNGFVFKYQLLETRTRSEFNGCRQRHVLP